MQKLFNFVRFRLHEIEMECLKHGWNSYYCTKCDDEFPDNSDTGIQRRDNGFFCRKCQLPVEDVTTENRKTRTQILFQNMRPLINLLKEIDLVTRTSNPVTGTLKPQPADPKRFRRWIWNYFLYCHLFLTYFFYFYRNDDGYLTVKPEEVVGNPDDKLISSGLLEGMAVGMPTSEDLFPDWIWNQESTTSAANEMPERVYSSINPYFLFKF